jgi:hypothetical protein
MSQGDKPMKYLIFNNENDALVCQAVFDMATGYPHGITYHAGSVEKHYNENRWAAGVPAQVWSWVHGRLYDIENELLTPEQIADLQSFQYLIDENWWPPL